MSSHTSAQVSDSFKLAVEWEDEDEVVVKVEPIQEDELQTTVIEAAHKDDLVSDEDWEADKNNVILRRYVNKKKKGKPVNNQTNINIEEITFRIEEDDLINLKSVPFNTVVDFEHLISLESATRSSAVTNNCSVSECLVDYDNSEQSSNVDEYSDRLLGYYRSSTSEEDIILPATGISEVKTPSKNYPIVKVAVDNKSTENSSGQRVIYLTKVPKEMVLQNAKSVTKLPGKVIVQKRDGPEQNASKSVKKTPIYSRTFVASSSDGRPYTPRSYLKQSEDVSIAKRSRVLVVGDKNTAENISIQNNVRIFMSSNRGRPKKPSAFKTPLIVRPVKPSNATDTGENESKNECHVCLKVFKTRSYLLAHSRIHTAAKRKPLTKKCDECGKMFGDNTQLRVHSRVHTGVTPYRCSLCSKQFKHQVSLSRHMLYHTHERPFSCDHPNCPKTYRNNSDLVNHKRVHTNETPFMCSHCGKAFRDRCARNAHEKIHDPIKKFACPICHRLFTQATTLKGHMVTHTDERPYGCSHCGKQFKSKVVLINHVRTHSGDKTFKCPVCSEMFAENRTLHRHVYTHDGYVKPFPCAFCKRWYFREDRWKAHVATHKDVARPFSCDTCLKHYRTLGYLRLHKMKAHGLIVKIENSKVYTCKYFSCIKKKFKTRKSLIKHRMKKHISCTSFQCDACKKTFTRKPELRKHLVTNHVGLPRHNVVGLVKKETVIKQEVLVDEYKCSRCEKLFRHKSTFARHIRGASGISCDL